MKRHGRHQDPLDKTFDAMLDRAREDFIGRQDRFVESLKPYTQWHYELDTCRIHFTGAETLECTFVPLATVVPDLMEWLWVWANDTMPDAAREASARVKELGESTGYGIFESPGFKVDDEDLDDLSALAVHHLDARGLFKDKDEDCWLFLAVL